MDVLREMGLEPGLHRKKACQVINEQRISNSLTKSTDRCKTRRKIIRGKKKENIGTEGKHMKLGILYNFDMNFIYTVCFSEVKVVSTNIFQNKNGLFLDYRFSPFSVDRFCSNFVSAKDLAKRFEIFRVNSSNLKL